MREILFRGKQHNGEWAYGFLYAKPYIKVSAILIEEESWMVDSETVGQYTGLIDKNGEKIYEGDIVRHYNRPGDPERFEIGLIRWDEVKASFERTSFPSPVRVNKECIYEVIGNIHDNPELLGGAE